MGEFKVVFKGRDYTNLAAVGIIGTGLFLFWLVGNLTWDFHVSMGYLHLEPGMERNAISDLIIGFLTLATIGGGLVILTWIGFMGFLIIKWLIPKKV